MISDPIENYNNSIDNAASNIQNLFQSYASTEAPVATTPPQTQIKAASQDLGQFDLMLQKAKEVAAAKKNDFVLFRKPDKPIEDNTVDTRTLEQLLKDEGFKFKVSSGYRPGSRTSSEHASNHSKKDENGNPMAYDIQPLDGDYDSFRQQLYNNDNVVNWMQQHGWGILNEDDAKIRAKTHGTGPHLHFGPDTSAVASFKADLDRLRKAQYGMKILPMFSELVQQSAQAEPEQQFILFRKPEPTPVQKMTKNPLIQNRDQTVSFKSSNQFAQTMGDIYSKILQQKGIDQSYVPYLVAQDALESGWGKHASGKNNLGGIKGKGSNLSTEEEVNGKLISTKASFKDFDSIEDYAKYKVNLLNTKRYRAFDGNFLQGLINGGYATSTTYTSQLQKIYNQLV